MDKVGQSDTTESIFSLLWVRSDSPWDCSTSQRNGLWKTFRRAKCSKNAFAFPQANSCEDGRAPFFLRWDWILFSSLMGSLVLGALSLKNEWKSNLSQSKQSFSCFEGGGTYWNYWKGSNYERCSMFWTDAGFNVRYFGSFAKLFQHSN